MEGSIPKVGSPLYQSWLNRKSHIVFPMLEMKYENKPFARVWGLTVESSIFKTPHCMPIVKTWASG